MFEPTTASASKRLCLEQDTESNDVPDDRVMTSCHDERMIISLQDGTILMASKSVLKEVPSFSSSLAVDTQQPLHRLHEGSSDAVLAIMAVVHHKLDRLPLEMSAERLRDLAAATRRYEITGLMSPHVESRSWIDHCWAGTDRPRNGDWGMWLEILWVFKATRDNRTRYERVLDMLATNMVRQDGAWFLKRGKHLSSISDIGKTIDRHNFDGKLFSSTTGVKV
jgi:hypothetical protein